MKETKVNRGNRTKRFLAFSVLGLVILAAAAITVPAKDKKYGIFVGISDYPGIKSDLPGAAPDAKNIRNLLVSKFRFLPADTTLLLDSAATRQNIIDKIKAYGALAGEGDVLVFHYSGHGFIFPDAYSEEIDETKMIEVQKYKIPLDYYDATLAPWDASSNTSGKLWKNHILDDELYNLFSPITKKGATVVFISDSCFSGGISKDEVVGARVRFMEPEQALGVRSFADLKLAKPTNQMKVETRIMNGSYIALSAASNDQSALDVTDRNNRSFGIFTDALLRVMSRATGPMSYKRLMELVAVQVSTLASQVAKHTQNPQLDTRFGSGDGLLFEPLLRAN